MSVSKSMAVKGSVLAGIVAAGSYGLVIAGGGALTTSASAAKPSAGPTVLQAPDAPAPGNGGWNRPSEPALTQVLRLTSAAPVRMPLDQYLTPLPQIRLIDAAERVSAAHCMHSLGFQSWTADTVQTEVPSDHSDVDFIDYLDPSAAKKGYPAQDQGPTIQGQASSARPAPTPSREAMEAYAGSTPQTADGRRIPQGGCFRTGEQSITGTGTLKADPRSLESMARTSAIQDSRVVRAIATWSSCMKTSGFRYQTPLDAQFFSPWSERLPGSSATGREEQVAVADAKCRTKTNLAGIYKSVEIAYQQRQLDANRPDIEASLNTFRGWVSRAHEVLGY